MEYLTKPLQAGTLALKNRLIMPPMATSKAEGDGSLSQAVLDYYDEKSRGGYISLIIIEHSYISSDGKASENQLSISEDRLVEPLKKLSGMIHQNGSKAVMQINHAGSNTLSEIIGTTPLAPSPVPNPRRGENLEPHELNHQEIEKIIQAFQNAALRVKKAGFDGVEIHSAHGYLLNQFFSPLTNKRADEYGGDVYSRIRIHLEVIQAIRKVTGPDFPILLRLGASDFTDGGTVIEDSQKAAVEFDKAGVNILDITGGHSGYVVPGLTGQGYFAPLSEAIKKAVSIPVILTGGVTDAGAADLLLAQGKADLIGVGRAILKDSGWAGKAINIMDNSDH